MSVKSFHYTHISKHWEPQTPHPAHMRPIHALPVQGTFMVATWNGGSAFSAKRFMSSSITTKPEVRPILAGENSRIGKLQDGAPVR
jgi:FAD synthase